MVDATSHAAGSAGERRRRRRSSWLQAASFAIVALAVLALAALAWSNLDDARQGEQQQLQESLARTRERVSALVQAAEMTAHSARQAALVHHLSAQSLQPLLQSLVPAFQQRPELSYLGVAVADTGEYGYLERSESDEISLWLYPAPTAAQARVQGWAYLADGWQKLADLPGEGYDPRTRPFYQAALMPGLAGTWMPAYRWIPRDGSAAPLWGLSYVSAVRDIDGRLLGVVDTDMHLPSLNRFVDALANDYGANLRVVETLPQQRVLAGPQVSREPVTLDPALAAVLDGDARGRVSLAEGSSLLASQALNPGPGLHWQLIALRPATAWLASLRQQALQWLLIAVLLGAGTVLVMARRRAERRLRQERDYADAMLEALPGVFQHYDQALRLRRWNHSLERVTGYTAQELEGMDAFNFVPPDQYPKLREGIEQVFDAGSFSLETDYLMKNGRRVPYLFTGVQLRLGGRPGFVGLGTDVSELKQAQQRVLYLATHDALTGLPNRNLLVERMQGVIAQVHAEGGVAALLLLDLDRFKLVNDGGGYPYGDALLKAVAQRLSDSLGEDGVVARQGGDEFMLLLPRLDTAAQAASTARAVLAALAAPLHCEGRRVHLEASIGVSVYPQDGQGIEELIGTADIAMYRAKALGGNQVQVFDQDMRAQARERVQLEAGLRTAIARGQLHLHYQPKVDLRDGRIVGSEALLRWQHPELGQVSPARFIPVAEASGLIVAIGDWVLRRACTQALAWSQAGLAGAKVAVNLSVRQLQQQDAVAWVQQVLDSTGLPAHLLELELTESVLAQDMQHVVQVITGLRALGVAVAIDDFGTGYSSLGYLKHLCVDTLKLDRSFIDTRLEEPREARIVTAAIALAGALGFTVVAEGVERASQCRFLAQHGCDQVQGYLFSPPVDAAAMERLLRQGRFEVDAMLAAPDPAGAG